MRWPWQKKPPAEPVVDTEAVKAEMARQFELLSKACGHDRGSELFGAHNDIESAMVAEIQRLNKTVSVRNAQLMELREMLAQPTERANDADHD